MKSPTKTPLRASTSLNRPVSLAFAAAAVIIGVVVVLVARGAGVYVALEAESGSIQAPATVVDDTGASGGKVVRFGTGTTPALKPMGAGLYWRGPSNATYSFIDHAFLNIDWDTLEPTNGSFNGPGWNEITSALNAGKKLRLRLFAGAQAPRWLDSISGSCVNIVTNDNETGCIPHFYKDSYLEQYRQLMTEVARRYESNAQVLDVVNSACMTISAEPFILGGDAAGAAMYSAGFTKAGQDYCLRQSTAIHMQAFATTRMSLATHVAWQQPAPGGITRSWPDERALLQSLRNQYGPRILYQNNGLANQTCNTNPSPDAAPDLYCYMKVIEIPKGFQQGCGQKVTDCIQSSVIEHALGLGGCFVEHATWNELTTAQARDYDAQLKAKCSG